MQRFWQVTYNLFAIPLQYVVFHLLGLFSAKVRMGIRGRRDSLQQLQKYAASRDADMRVFVVHCASLGEYEMAKPIIERIREQRPEINIVLTFFSPSGYEQIHDENPADLVIYLPFDSIPSVRRFYELLRPEKLILASYEIWPNLIWQAKIFHIEVYVTSARLRPGSAKTWPLIRNFYSTVFQEIEHIYPITDQDRDLIQKYLLTPGKTEMRVLGNTRYDRVLERSATRADEHILPQEYQHQPTLVAGSIWPHDNRIILPVLHQILEEYPTLKVILAPHEPTQEHVRELEEWCRSHHLSMSRYSQLNGSGYPARILLLDSVGILAELYRDGDIAFVGGGFHGSVHNVMEPAAARCVVTFGPDYHNSNEAELLIEAGGGFAVKNETEFTEVLHHLLANNAHLSRTREVARRIIEDNAGATRMTVSRILDNSENPDN